MNSNGQKHKFQRSFSNFLINPRFQMKYSFNFIVCFLVAMAGIHAYLFYELHSFIQEFSIHYPIQSEFHLQLYDILNQMILVTVVTIGISAVGLFFISINLSHKIAGPIYVIQNTIEKLLDEKYDIRPHLRKGDELNEIYEALARLAEKYKNISDKNSRKS